MIWLIGSKGMLGSRVFEILEASGEAFLASDLEVDITASEAVKGYLARHPRISLLINCSAYTNVDLAESQPEAAYRLNEEGVKNLAEAARERDLTLIHLSTDYVFDGKATRPYRETDPTGPRSVYGASKLAGEQAALTACPKTLIIRTAWLYDGHGKNFLLTMLRVFREKGVASVVADQTGSPTLARDLAQAIYLVAQRLIEDPSPELYGIYHFTNLGETTWHGFAQEIANQAHELGLIENLPKIEAVSSSKWPTPVERPGYSVLDKSKINATFGLEIPSWESAVRSCLLELKSRG